MLRMLVGSEMCIRDRSEIISFAEKENKSDLFTFDCLGVSTEISYSMECFCTSIVARFDAESVHNHSISWFVSKIVHVIPPLEGQPSFSSWKLLCLANSQWYILSIYVDDTICANIESCSSTSESNIPPSYNLCRPFY